MSTFGRIGVTGGTEVVDRVIQAATFGRYNHAVVAVSDIRPGGKVEVVEAGAKGAVRREVDATRFVWDAALLSSRQRETIVTAALQCVGLPYDWRDIARFAVFHRLGKIRGWTRDHPDTHVICSEICAWALAVAKTYPFGRIAPGDVSPNDLAQWMFECSGLLPTAWRGKFQLTS